MNLNLPRQLNRRNRLNRLNRVVAWLSAYVVLLVAIVSAPAYAETKTVVAEGASGVCFSTREIALDLARTSATNEAHNECDALGLGWRYSGNKFTGYEQCTSCGSNGFKCNVKQAVYICINMQKERDEKAAQERAEKAAATQLAKEKSDREKAEREARQKAVRDKAERERADKIAAAKIVKDKADHEKAERAAQAKVTREKADKDRAEQASKARDDLAAKKKPQAAESNSIDDAFSKMEKQTGKSPSPKVEGIDAEFGKMEAYRTEQERLRVVAIKEKQEREAVAQALKARHDEAVHFCAALFKTQASCIESTCGEKQGKFYYVVGPRTTCAPGTACYTWPTQIRKDNPKYSEWESCTANAASQCARNTPTGSADECVSARERTARTR